MPEEATAPDTGNERHLVVALKYRPQTFQSLVGQDHIATALGNAIRQSRVGHAYLFTGARGVGKTSSARIFAKCLNCVQAPTAEPCEACEACQAISVGEDVDVLEIDGASNRGIDEIRQLRANAAVRPSRSPNKIYIIDEVHMLTKEAFNALLKTLEEPPAHVKFIFCTTDPEKIPITVLSRCQRFDFSPVQTSEIATRLKLIATEEGVAIDDQALALLARRANGSMRDSQSLLEQMLSFCDTKISIEDVHQLLGTADISRIAEVATAIAQQDAATGLNLIHEGIFAGIDTGQMASQLLGYFRDMMAVRVGCNEETLLNCSPQDIPQLKELADQFGLETMLSITQIFDSTIVKMQHSLHSRTLLEMAIVRGCNLEHLDSMSDLIASLAQGGPAKSANKTAVRPRGNRPKLQQVNDPSSKKKVIEPARASLPKNEPTVDSPPTGAVVVTPAATALSSQPAIPATEPTPTEPANEIIPSATSVRETKPAIVADSEPTTALGGEELWRQVTEQLDGMTADMAKDFHKVNFTADNRLEVTLADKVNKEFCSKAERKQQIEQLLSQVTGRDMKIDFLAARKDPQHQAIQPKLTRVQQIRQLEGNDFVSNAISLFDAEIIGFKEGRRRP